MQLYFLHFFEWWLFLLLYVFVLYEEIVLNSNNTSIITVIRVIFKNIIIHFITTKRV